MKKTKRECEDCGEEVPTPERRSRCPACELMVCLWCFHHIHGHMLRAGKEKRS